jgi:hypothetical protein
VNYKQLIAGQEELVRKIIDFFTSKAIDPDFFNRIQEFRRNDKVIAKYVPNLELLIKLGHLTLWDFLMFNGDYAQKKGIPTALVEAILQRMVEKWILVAEPLLQQGQRAYAVNESLTQFLAGRNCLMDVIFGFQFIAEKYQDSIFKIAVEDQAGDHHIGTGFLISLPTDPRDTSIVVTNEHVVRDAKAIRVLRRTNESVQHKRIIPAKISDLAVIELAAFQELPALCIAEDPKVLDEVISIGYPNVAMALDSYQLTHRGEINSVIQDRNSRTLILFSAKTGPGNSGGPLINEMGLVVGAVCEDLFYKEALIEKGQLPYHAAIPASAMTQFLVGEYSKPNSLPSFC